MGSTNRFVYANKVFTHEPPSYDYQVRADSYLVLYREYPNEVEAGYGMPFVSMRLRSNFSTTFVLRCIFTRNSYVRTLASLLSATFND